MFGTRLPRRLVANSRRHVLAVGFLLAATLCLYVLTAPAEIVTTVPPPIPAVTSTLPNEPALPSDPTSPATVGTTNAPAMSLIPTQPLAPPEPPPRRPGENLPQSRVGALPGGLTPEPFNTPPPAASTPADATTVTANDIGAVRRFQYNFGLTLGGTFDDNIFLEPTRIQSDFYFTLQPTLSLGFGGGKGGGNDETVIRFTYSPEVRLYIEHPELDAVQHFVSLSGSHRFSRLTISGSQDVQILDSTDVGNPHPYTQQTAGSGLVNGSDTGSPIVNNPNSNVNLDVGRRTRSNVYSTNLRADYVYSDKISYNLGGQFGVTDYEGDLLSSSTISGSGFVDYSITGKTTVGVGLTAGYVFSEGANPDQSFEQANVRLSYNPGPKLSFNGQVGLELRQAGRGGSESTPVFDLSASYSPFDGTSIGLTGSRRVLTSAVIGGQNYASTNLALTLNQRFFQRFYLHLNVGYTNSDYVTEADGSDAGRSDNYFFLQPGVDFRIHENILVGGFYSFRSSDSSFDNRDFTDQQTGLRVSVYY